MSKKSIKSDLTRIDRMKDREIDYSDIPRLDKSFLKKATTAWPPVKKQLTIRLDADVLAWLKRHGRGYQTRINRILRVAMESQPPRATRRSTFRRLFRAISPLCRQAPSASSRIVNCYLTGGHAVVAFFRNDLSRGRMSE